MGEHHTVITFILGVQKFLLILLIIVSTDNVFNMDFPLRVCTEWIDGTCCDIGFNLHYVVFGIVFPISIFLPAHLHRRRHNAFGVLYNCGRSVHIAGQRIISWRETLNHYIIHNFRFQINTLRGCNSNDNVCFVIIHQCRSKLYRPAVLGYRFIDLLLVFLN